MSTSQADPVLTEAVPLLMEQHFSVELIEAVLGDPDGIDPLLVVCARMSGGDAATLSVVFGELSACFDRTPHAVEAILDSFAPAAEFAEWLGEFYDTRFAGR
jgi:hypothetical protein